MKPAVYPDRVASPSTRWLPLFQRLLVGLIVVAVAWGGGLRVRAEETVAERAAVTAPATDWAQVEPEPKPPKPLPAPQDAVRVNPRQPVWVDRKNKRVLVDGEVSLRRGVLEMFACPRGTKEHESVVAVNTPAFVVHAALLAVGAVPGKPVQWEPRYAPPTGDEIRITLEWRKDGRDDGPMQSADARQWVRDLRTNKAMEQPWVFGGSGFWKDEETGREHYLAESGDMICVSNFGTAMLDVPDHSPQTSEGLLFEAFTENIPPLGTPVRLILTPVKKPKQPEPKFQFEPAKPKAG